jgi:hypothetical protein
MRGSAEGGNWLCFFGASHKEKQNMSKTIDGGELVSKLLADPDVKAEYDKMKPVMERVWKLAEAGSKAKKSQTEGVPRRGPNQSA